MAQDKFTVRLRGNLGNDPEWIGATGNMLKISVGSKSGDKTIWQPVIFFNNDRVKLADWAAAQMRKGTKVVIDGRGNYNEFTTSGGTKVRVFEVIAEDFDVIQTAQQSVQQSMTPQQPITQQQSMTPQQPITQQQPANSGESNGYGPAPYQPT